MNFEIIALPNFNRELKKLAKKYLSLKEDFAKLLDSLLYQPQQGTSLGNNCYQVRMAITSKNKGKSAGARVITYLYTAKNALYLLTIYDKSTEETVPAITIKELLTEIP